jgi:tripartite-type tricarboxylate transporter receptor subunit TctC
VQLNQRLNGNVIVDLKLGGSGTIGLAHVARAAPDGYTFGMGTSTALTSAPHLIKSPGYDVARSFTYLGLIQTSRQVLVVSPQLGVNALAEFVALAKAKPGALNFGSSGIGNSIHLAAEEFNSAVGIKAVHIPFKTARRRTRPSSAARCNTPSPPCPLRSGSSTPASSSLWW